MKCCLRLKQAARGSEFFVQGVQGIGFRLRATFKQDVSQRVQSTYMVQSMVSVVVISLMVWVSIPHMDTYPKP